MGVWKWMKHADCSPASLRLPCRGNRLPVLVLVCLISTGTLASESSLGLRVMPAWYFPVGDSLLEGGFGVAVAADFMPAPFFGLFAQGEYIGVGLKNVSGITVTDGSLGAGFIWRLRERLSLRADIMAGVYSATWKDTSISGISAGLRASANYAISPVLSASVFGGFRHFAYTPEPFMNAVNVGAGVTVDLSEFFGKRTNIAVAAKEQDPVFPVFYSWYDENGFAVVTVTNTEKVTITDITASFYLEQYMGQPKVCSITKALAPGESFDVPLKGFFNESMLELTEKIDTEAKVLVEYSKLGAKRTASVPVAIPVYHRNAMSWDDDRKAAAFVSSKDPAALWFSKYVSSIVRDRFRPGSNRNMQYAMGVFESLNAYGINYVIDPSSSYADNAGSSASIDFLQFPYQTLMYRGGDCDDLSILFCSLMEAIGIDTAFITIPGHIFAAFDSGMTESEAKSSFYAPDQLAYKDGRAWVPVEITLTREGFNKAWRIGAKEWGDSASRNTANLYPMEASWKIYKPVSVPGAASRFSLPDEKVTAVAFDQSLDTYIEREIRPQILAQQKAIAKSNTPENRNRLGVLYGKFGMVDEARAEFSLAAKQKYPLAWTNLGNIAFMEQKYTEALGFYEYARTLDATDTVALLGAARCNYENDEFVVSDTLYAELRRTDAPLASQYGYLGSFFETRGRAFSLADRLSTTTWKLPREAVAVAPVIAATVVDTPVVAAPVTETKATAAPELKPVALVALAPVEKPAPEAVAEKPAAPAPSGLTSMLSIGKTELVSTVAAEKPAPAPKKPVQVTEPELFVAPAPAPAIVEKPVIITAASVVENPAPAPILPAAPVPIPVPEKAPIIVEKPVILVVAPEAEKPSEPAVLPPANVAVAEPVLAAVEPVSAEPDAVEPEVAAVAEPLQISPAEVKASYTPDPALEPVAVTVAVTAPEPIAASAAVEITKPDAPVKSNSIVPVIATVVAGVTAAAAAVSIRLRSKRKNLKSRNKS